jgi:hypothetical protein
MIIGSDCVYAVVVDSQWVPYVNEWQLINMNMWEGNFDLWGNFEYCDQWGKYYCMDYSVYYHPAPVSRFAAETRECSAGFPPRMKESEMGRTAPDAKIEILPRCEQPEEHTEREKEGQ